MARAQPDVDEPPSAESIFDRYVAVTGGRAAYDRVQNQITQLTVSRDGQVVANSTVFQTRPGDFRLVSVTGGKAIETGLNAGVAWSLDPESAALLETEEERGRVLEGLFLLPEGRWRRFYKEADWETGVMLDDKPRDQIAATPFVGESRRLSFDLRTGLLVKQEVYEPEGWIESQFEDYFDAGGIPIARRRTITINDVTFLLTADSVKFNQSIPASTFELPAEIARLLQKKPGQ